MQISQTTFPGQDATQAPATFLVGDVGGTNCRLALASRAGAELILARPRAFKCADFAGVDAAIDAYADAIGWDGRLSAAVLAIAGPVKDGAVQSTNMAWRMSEAQLGPRAGGRARLINDYTALALSLEQMNAADSRSIGPDLTGDPSATVAVIGGGTGFGAGALMRGVGGWTAIATEGGHMSFAPVDDLEIEILRSLTRRFGRVSIERLISGPGLFNLYLALAEIEGVTPGSASPEDIVAAAEAGDGLCARALAGFCAIYGSVAGDFALAYGARGGVYLGGGIAPAIAGHLAGGAFRARFEAKGRFRDYLAAVPTRIIVNPYAALIGAASLAVTLTESVDG